MHRSRLRFDARPGCNPPDDATLAYSVSATTTANSTTTTTTTTTTATSTSDTTTLDTTTEEPCNLFFCVDVPPHVDCDIFLQDCPRGDKCMPWSNNGGAWNDTKCVPVTMDPDALGEPCQVEGSGVSGVDTCDEALMCWNVDPDTLTGVCVALCAGTLELCVTDPESCCPAGWVCFVAAESLALCIETCDPLAEACEGPMEACYPVDSGFQCGKDISGGSGAAGDPCEFINACDPGTYCGDPATFPGCDPNAAGCCVPFCPLDAQTCPPGTECTPWYDVDPPPHYENLGACVIPN